MASAYSIIHNYGNPESNFDFDLISKVMGYKQQKFDANLAKIDAVYSKLENIDLARDVDRQYFAQRLNSLTNEINSASQEGGLDLSNNSLMRNINQHIDQVYDDNVMQAMIETSKFRNYQASVAKIKEDSPELYNQTNEAFGMAPFIDYMNNQEVGAKIKGDLYYEPYKDVEGDLRKTALEFQKAFKGQKIETVDAVGNKITREINSLSPAEIRQIALSQLGSKYDRQLQINAWGRFGGYQDPTMVQNSLTDYVEKRIEHNNTEISGLELRKTQEGITDAEIENLDNQIKSIKDNSILMQQSVPDMLKSPQNAGTYLEKEFAVNALVSSMEGFYKESVTLGKNEVYFETLNYNFKVNRAKADDLFRQKELEIDLANLELNKRKTAAAEKTANGSALNPNDITFVGGNNELEEVDKEEKIKTSVQTDVDVYEENMAEILKGVESLAKGSGSEAQEAQQLLDQYEKQLAKKDTRTNSSKYDALVEVMASDDFKNLAIYKNSVFLDEKGLPRINKAVMAKTRADYLQDLYIKNDETASKKIYDEYIDNEKYMQEYVDNPNIRIMLTSKNGGLKSYSVGELLIKRGIFDPKTGKKLKDMNETTVVLDGKTIGLGDALVRNHFVSAAINSIPEHLGTGRERPFYSKELGVNYDTPAIRQLALKLGERPEDIYTETETGEKSIAGIAIKKTTLNPESKTYKYLQEGARLGIYDQNKLKDQDLTSDDSDINTYMQKMRNRRGTTEYKEGLDGVFNQVSLAKNLVVDGTSDLGKNLKQLMQHKGLKTTAGQAVTMEVLADQIKLTELVKVDTDKYKPQSILVPKTDFMRQENTMLRQLMDSIDMKETEQVFTGAVMKGRELTSGKLTMSKTVDEVGASAGFLADMGIPHQAELLAKGDAPRYFAKNGAVATLDYYDKNVQKNSFNVMKTIENIYKIIDQFSVGVTADNNGYSDFVKTTVYHKGKPLFSNTQANKKDAGDEANLLFNTPQVLFGQILQKQLEDEANRKLNNLDYSEEFMKVAKVANETVNQQTTQ